MADKLKVGTVGFCLKTIKDYVEASDSDPKLKEKKAKAKKAVDYLETILGGTPDEVQILGCSANMWIE